MNRVLTFLVLFVVFDLLILGYVVYRHERVHAKVAEYFGYSPGGVHFLGESVSLSTAVPVSDLNTCKYWAYLAAQSSVDAVGYHVLMLVPVLAVIPAAAGTWLLEGWKHGKRP